MSHAGKDIAISSSFTLKVKDYLQSVGRSLKAYRPRWRDHRFWILQFLIVILIGFDISIDFSPLHDQLKIVYFLPVSLMLIPIAFAALTYGFVGAITTALWVTVLIIPEVVMGHGGLERLGIIAELLLLTGMASIIGKQVDRERGLQKQTENTANALKASTMKYQGLLETSPIAVMVVSPSGAILEVNPAASILFAKNKMTLESMKLSEIFDEEDVMRLLANSRSPYQPTDSLRLDVGGRQLFLEPRLTESNDGKGNPVIQVLLRDVTEEYQRRAGLRAYAAEVLRALEEERQLMARELHDQTIQALILLCNHLNDAEELAAVASPPLTSKLHQARQNGEEIVQGLRNFAKSLRPPILDDLGITISIRRHVTDFTERTKIESQLIIAGQERRLPSNTELGIFRIAQEALRNIERHAEATNLAVTVTFTKHGVRLDVIDNGVGLSMPANSGDFTASGHLGLISMQERAQLLAGKLEIRSSPGKGTRVTLFIPDTAIG
ncbi:MAG: histidine kinase [Dehalococcoidales bacterium]|nr:histidine kinase [Dehalococcoidales bacterium]